MVRFLATELILMNLDETFKTLIGYFFVLKNEFCMKIIIFFDLQEY